MKFYSNFSSGRLHQSPYILTRTLSEGLTSSADVDMEAFLCVFFMFHENDKSHFKQMFAEVS